VKSGIAKKRKIRMIITSSENFLFFIYSPFFSLYLRIDYTQHGKTSQSPPETKGKYRSLNLTENRKGRTISDPAFLY
jgi:hypothetical protein